MTDTATPLGLPAGTRACLFDLDGVLTSTAVLHAQAWKQMFDDFLAVAAPEQPEFDRRDYEQYVDGKPRLDGTHDFLAARGIVLTTGNETDPPDAATLWGLSNRKNDLIQELIRTHGVEVYPGSVDYVRAVRAAGLRTAVVTSSANAVQVLDITHLTDLFDARIDGVVARERHMKGKPAPDTFLAGAEAVGATAADSAVFEDALAGVAAGRAGGFSLVVGVDRVGQADELRASGADVVVTDLAELLP
ncbi:beta-phosphoglucomutase family hydrolase [Sporichthya polymorpha]|uniref:beta-phosphoglucomutase family hydrolase n=1 Tax=Sporichthya polymorpha TaxID=35751 RepID=UPI00036702E1|nr:beta-phosphoglucomutase family hydrolase [Sporichthya polymorpha]